MPKFDIDLTTADVIPDGDYVAIIKKAETRDTKDGANKYISWLLQLPGAGNRTIFHSTSHTVPRMIKAMMDASKTPYDTSGFDPDGAIEKQINIRVGQKDDPVYGLQNVVVKVWAV
jgi:hypothetical protein